MNKTLLSLFVLTTLTISCQKPKEHDIGVYELRKDPSRFIAHAGGGIDGQKYTNSKEALDLNYAKGFRLFELDIRETKDKQLIATHDWEDWAKMTGYTGELPVSREVFLSKKILGKYTPLDMNAINKWFIEHPDAILVTDKINEPVRMSKLFVDKRRLLMELFSQNAIAKGLNIGIRSDRSVILSQGTIDTLKISNVRNLAMRGVRRVAISRFFIKDNKELLLEFKKFGIKVFAFHVAPKEEEVIRTEMAYIYGIYADEWTFE